MTCGCYVVTPGPHQDISPLRVCGHEECIVCISGYGIWLCGVHYISGDRTPFAMFLSTWPICLDLVEGLLRQYDWVLSCR